MYKALFNITKELFMVADLQGRVLVVNPAFREALGWTVEGLSGADLRWQDLIHPDDVSRDAAGYGAEVVSYTCRTRCGGGSYLWVSWGMTPLSFGGAPCLLAAGRDVTSQRKTRQALIRAIKDLNDFASVASHELRSPLRRIVGLSEMIRETVVDLPAETQELLQWIIDETYSMEDVVTALLHYSRLQSQVPKADPVDLEAVFEQSRRSVLLDVRSKGGAVTYSVEQVGRLPTVVGDHRQLKLMFNNLLGNALKFNSLSHHEVRVSHDPETGEFTFEDNGDGVPESHLERVFEMFERASSDFPGHGVGLALCRGIVERHHGKIWVESHQGGSRFKFTLGSQGTSER